jgi:hypothetical protein
MMAKLGGDYGPKRSAGGGTGDPGYHDPPTRPYKGNMSTEGNMPPVPEARVFRPEAMNLSDAEQQAWSGSGYQPASPPGDPGRGGRPVGVTKGLPTER